MGSEGLLQLPDLAPAIRTLHNEESRRLIDNWSTWQSCEICKGKRTFRWWSTDEREEVADYECPCIDQWVAHRYFLHLGVQKHWQHFAWQDLFPDLYSVVDRIDFFREGQERYLDAGIGLLLQGESGRGKTALAALLFKEIVAYDRPGYFTTSTNLGSMYTATWGNEEERLWYTMNILNAPVLVIDDLGRERTSAQRKAEVFREMIDVLLRHRLSASLPTFITTTSDTDKLEDQFGGAFTDLLKNSLRAVTLEGEDHWAASQVRVDEEFRLGLTRPVVVS